MDEIPEMLSKEEIQELPLDVFSGEVLVVDSDKKLSSALEKIASAKVLGFDTETRPNFRKGQDNPVSLLQLCDGKSALLIQLKNITQFDPLIALFEDEEITKTGVAIHDDIKGLQKLFSFEAAGFVDSAKLAKTIGYTKTGLRNLAATLLGIRISKSAQLSNWAKEELTDQQISYAATDAWISNKLFLALQKYL